MRSGTRRPFGKIPPHRPRHRCGLAILSFALVTPALAVTDGNVADRPLEPAAPWTVEYADELCVASRPYRSGKQHFIVGIRQYPQEHPSLALWVSSNSARVTGGKAELGFDQQPAIEMPYRRGPVAIKGLHLIALEAKPNQLAALGSSRLLRVSAGNLGASFKLGNISGAMNALKACERDLLLTWGMDAEVLSSIATFPKDKVGLFGLLDQYDYPLGALIDERQGITSVRFWVGTDGSVSGCHVVRSSGSADFDDKACQIMTDRAILEPARTADGRPVRSVGFRRFRFELHR